MKILLVADVPNWAFDRDADAVIKYLPQYQIYKTYTGNFNPSFLKQYDHVHFMNWLEGMPYVPKVSGGVSSHNFELLHKGDAKRMFPKSITISMFFTNNIISFLRHSFSQLRIF